MNKRRHVHGSIPAQITYLNLPHQRVCQDECNGHVNHLIQSLDAKVTLPRRWWVEIGIIRVGWPASKPNGSQLWCQASLVILEHKVSGPQSIGPKKRSIDLPLGCSILQLAQNLLIFGDMQWGTKWSNPIRSSSHWLKGPPPLLPKTLAPHITTLSPS